MAGCNELLAVSDKNQNKLAIFSYLTNLLNFDAAEHVILFLWQVRKWG